MSATHIRSGASAVNWRLTRSGGIDRRRVGIASLLALTAPVDALDPRGGHQPGDLLAVPPPAAIVDLGCQSAGSIDASVLGPGLAELVSVEIGPGDGRAATADRVVERARADVQGAAEETDGIDGLLRGDEPMEVRAGHRSVSRRRRPRLFAGSPSPTSSATRRRSRASSRRFSPLTAAGRSRRSARVPLLGHCQVWRRPTIGGHFGL
jgi:hypothetical protein